MSDLTTRQRQRPSATRALGSLGLVFVFCVSALVAGGAFETETDPSKASTRILTPEEAVLAAEQATAPGDVRSVPVALIGALLFVAGALLISLAIPTRVERGPCRRDAGATNAAARATASSADTTTGAGSPGRSCGRSARRTPLPGGGGHAVNHDRTTQLVRKFQ
jgi:hypothetical protein